MAASRAVARHFARDLAARSPFQTATERDAAHGTMRADADLGQHLDRELAAVALRERLDDGDRRLTARRVGRREATVTEKARLPVAATSPTAARPAPVGEHDALAHPQPADGDRVVRLVAGDLDGRPHLATPSSDGTRWTGRLIGRGHQSPLNASRSRPNMPLCSSRTWPVGFSSPRIAASSRSSSSWRASSRVGVSTSTVTTRSPRPAPQARHAATAEHLGRPRTGCRAGSRARRRSRHPSAVGLLLVDQVGLERRQGQRGAERGRGHRHRDRAVQVVAVPGERRVRGDVDLDVEVAGRAAAGPDLALLGQLDAGAGVDAGGDLDGQGAARADPAVAGALAARVGDDRAEAAAGGAGPQGADLAEERPLHVGDLARAVAGLAGDRLRAGRRALAVAGRADDRGVDLELAGDAERRLGEVDLEPDQGVLAAARARPRTAGDRPGRRPAWPPKKASMMSVNEKPGTLAEAHAAEQVAAAVVRRPLLRVAEDLVGPADLLEPLLGLRVGVDVGVQLPRQAAVGLLDRLGVRVAGHAEEVVGVLAHEQSFEFSWFRWLRCEERSDEPRNLASSRMRET